MLMIMNYLFLLDAILKTVFNRWKWISKEDNENDFLLFVKRDIEKAIIPSNIRKICSYSFNECKNLKIVEFQSDSKLEIIDEYSYSYSGLESITIPSDVTVIKKNSFIECKNLESVYFSSNSNLKTIEKSFFFNNY